MNPAETAPSWDDATTNIASDVFTKKKRGHRVEIAAASPRSGVVAVVRTSVVRLVLTHRMECLVRVRAMATPSNSSAAVVNLGRVRNAREKRTRAGSRASAPSRSPCSRAGECAEAGYFLSDRDLGAVRI